MTHQQIASLVRQAGAIIISAGYAWLTAAGHTKGIPVAVDTAIVAFGPLVVTVEHYLSDPSTGNPPPPRPVADPAPTLAPWTPTTTGTSQAPLQSAPLPPTAVPQAPVAPQAPPPPLPIPQAWGTMATDPTSTLNPPVPTVPTMAPPPPGE